MKYSLRSLMMVLMLVPPALAGIYFWATRASAWLQCGSFLIAWFLLFVVLATFARRWSPAKLGISRPRATCSFCKRPDLETGALAEGPEGVLICYSCASLCRELIEKECLSRGVEPGSSDWYAKGLFSTEPSINTSLPKRPEE